LLLALLVLSGRRRQRSYRESEQGGINPRHHASSRAIALFIFLTLILVQTPSAAFAQDEGPAQPADGDEDEDNESDKPSSESGEADEASGSASPSEEPSTPPEPSNTTEGEPANREASSDSGESEQPLQDKNDSADTTGDISADTDSEQAPTVNAADAAALAHAVHQEHCARLAAGDKQQAASAILAVTPVWAEVDEVLDATGESYLVYWAGMLSLCLGQEPRGIADLKRFLSLEQGNSQFTMLVRDAERRLRRLGIKIPKASTVAGSGDATEQGRPFLLALGAGYQGLVQPSSDGSSYHYASFALDVSIKLVGPLRLDVLLRPALSDRAQAKEGDTTDHVRSLLWAFAVGPELQFDGPVRPRVGLFLQLAPNPSGTLGGPVFVGLAAGAGIDIPLGPLPLAVRIAGEVGGMASPSSEQTEHMLTVRGLAQLVLALGG